MVAGYEKRRGRGWGEEDEMMMCFSGVLTHSGADLFLRARIYFQFCLEPPLLLKASRGQNKKKKLFLRSISASVFGIQNVSHLINLPHPKTEYIWPHQNPIVSLDPFFLHARACTDHVFKRLTKFPKKREMSFAERTRAGAFTSHASSMDFYLCFCLFYVYFFL